MIQIICTVYDEKAQVFGRPFTTQSIGVAIRMFDDEVNRASTENVMYNHSGDFVLYQVGQFNDQTGEIEVDKPKQLIRADQVKKGDVVNAQK